MECDYPPWPAQLGIYDQITLWVYFQSLNLSNLFPCFFFVYIFIWVFQFLSMQLNKYLWSTYCVIDTLPQHLLLVPITSPQELPFWWSLCIWRGQDQPSQLTQGPIITLQSYGDSPNWSFPGSDWPSGGQGQWVGGQSIGRHLKTEFWIISATHWTRGLGPVTALVWLQCLHL